MHLETTKAIQDKYELEDDGLTGCSAFIGLNPTCPPCWPGCARRSQGEPRPRAPRYKRQGQLRCRLVRFGFGRCWGLFGGIFLS
jgi:hypothetical protein